MARPWDAWVSPRLRSNIVSEEYYCTQENGLSLVQPGFAERTSPEGMPVPAMNSPSMPAYFLLMLLWKGDSRKGGKPYLVLSQCLKWPFPCCWSCFLVHQQRLSNAYIPKSMSSEMHSSPVWDWSRWFFLSFFLCLGIDALLSRLKALGVHSYYLSHPIYHPPLWPSAVLPK